MRENGNKQGVENVYHKKLFGSQILIFNTGG